ncbi:MAG: hypothetical protein ACFNX0_05380 [Treponema sp.]
MFDGQITAMDDASVSVTVDEKSDIEAGISDSNLSSISNYKLP